jgi:glycosyltransferase involved in cell wall biosynthesis
MHLATVGRLSPQKGQLVLLDALAILAREGVAFRMTIAGDGPLRSQLERRIRELGLEKQVELAGSLSNSDVRALIRDARALVLPSFAEGLPVVLMEAFALGKPVIATYVAGIPELVTDQTCGWLVPAGSVDSLVNAIKQCLKTPDAQIRAMGAAGRSRVLKQHDIAKECRKLADLFRGEKSLRAASRKLPHSGEVVSAAAPLTDAVLHAESS